MEDYTFELVFNALSNLERIRSFVERSTIELFPLYYELEIPKDFRMSEGHTLEDLSPHTTRIPGKDSLKENLIVLLADVESALSILEPLDRLEVVLTLDEGLNKSKEIVASEHVRSLIQQMVDYLNGN